MPILDDFQDGEDVFQLRQVVRPARAVNDSNGQPEVVVVGGNREVEGGVAGVRRLFDEPDPEGFVVQVGASDRPELRKVLGGEKQDIVIF